MNDDELEQMFRRSLRQHADDVEDTGGRAAAAHAGVRRRHRIQGIVTSVAVVGLGAPVAILSVLLPGSVSTTATVKPPVGAWRIESYRGVQLQVPASWGWGSTGTVVGGKLLSCGARAYTSATSFEDIRPPRQPVAAAEYVGRPTSDSGCAGSIARGASVVWLGSSLPVGATPQTGVTVSVRGTQRFKITVRDSNVLERRAILGSIRPVLVDVNGCSSKIENADSEQAPPPPDSVTSISVCVYYSHEYLAYGRRPAPYLYYSTRVVGDASSTARAILAGGRPRRAEPDDLCLGSSPTAINLIEHAGDESYVWYLQPNECPGQSVTYNHGSEVHLVTRDSVRRWAVDAIPLYARGASEDNALARYLPSS
jgi:hypothetical protein